MEEGARLSDVGRCPEVARFCVLRCQRVYTLLSAWSSDTVWRTANNRLRSAQYTEVSSSPVFLRPSVSFLILWVALLAA